MVESAIPDYNGVALSFRVRSAVPTEYVMCSPGSAVYKTKPKLQSIKDKINA
ncbi:hypothetical protein J2Z83_003235 [Virgibacillus natechei]|uniref:Uncharacterized protein n=1 Tax=Virgibacillus natechei TaxID=1216297 RepID=A0ABS4IL00_9BACI|nr:hypothetical protein [Virgibacillus natechei]